MGVIKSTNSTSSSPPPAVVRLSLRDIEAEAQSLVDRANHEAERILADAQRRAAELEADARAKYRDDAWREGHADGAEQGRSDAIERYEADIRMAVTSLSSAAAAIEASRNQLEHQALDDVVRLALAIAQRITRRVGMIDPGVLKENLREVMNLLVHRDDVRIAIHPTQRATLNDLLPQLKLQWPTLTHIDVVEDERVSPGGCRVTAGQGAIDADLQGQLDRITAELIPDTRGGTTS
jgi:flagellar assembly protein FliH